MFVLGVVYVVYLEVPQEKEASGPGDGGAGGAVRGGGQPSAGPDSETGPEPDTPTNRKKALCTL